jgi:hypothetical protein
LFFNLLVKSEQPHIPGQEGKKTITITVTTAQTATEIKGLEKTKGPGKTCGHCRYFF